MTDSLQSEETTLSQPIMDSISDLCNEMMMNIHPLIAEPPHLHEMSTETNISYIEQKMTEFEQKSHEFMDKMKNKTLNISDPLQQLIKLEKRMQIINELVSTHFAPPLLRSNAVEKFKTAKQAVLDDQLLRYSLQLTQVAPLLSTTNLLVSRLASLSDAHEQAFKLSSIIQNVEQDRHAMKMQLDTIETQLDKALHSANEASKQIQSNYTFLKQRIGAT
ncbi:hypothetical protein BLNAU_11919 [Blattamonas nauphoetae]|uniref:Uncharacterized protein n=1 Tax=Blattamonas nauphoetae TaxID=2049346 RepID=A0ABQ9XP59_9EUKA|nr:hypothetical protein BLNAU_11919 [Blattamonas nauphoetae]